MKNIKSSEYIKDTSKEYSIYVCSNRAIPSVTDGLKDGQRKFLWLMRNKADKIKTVSLSGLSIQEELFLHGDSSASDTISGLAAPYLNNITFLEGIGTFGTKVNPSAFGAPRYTYVRRNKAAENIIYTDLDVVPLKDNHDGSNKSAQTFLPIIPTVLLNGVSGIAVGWSTEILPHKLEDLIDGCINVLDNKKVKELKPFYNNYNVKINRIEGNSWEMIGTIDIVDTSTVRVIELPPDLNLEKFKDRLNTLEDEDKIRGYTDKSTDQINITIDFKRGSVKDMTPEQIIDLLKLRSRRTQRIVVIGWDSNSIQQYDKPEELVKDFVNWRLTWYTKRYEYLLELDEYELNFQKALKECFDKKLPAKILSIKTRELVKKTIEQTTKAFNLDDQQAEKILNLATYRWSEEYYDECIKRIKELEANIKTYKRILKNPQEIRDIYKEELVNLKKAKF